MPRKYSYDDTGDHIAYDLGLVAEEFELFPLEGVESPAHPSEWAQFLLNHPEYPNSTAFHGLASRLTKREAFEGLDEPLQHLGAALMRVTFSNEEPEEIAGI